MRGIRDGGLRSLRHGEQRRYPTDLSDKQWLCICPHLPEPTGQERPRIHALRAILDAIYYVLKSGCPWRLLPREFPPWKTLYDDWFRRWRIDGTWGRLNAELCAGLYEMPAWQGPRSQRSDSRLPVGQDHGSRRERARLRARQESGWHSKRHLLLWTPRLWCSKCAYTQRQGARPRGHQSALLEQVQGRFGHLSHLWVDAG